MLIYQFSTPKNSFFRSIVGILYISHHYHFAAFFVRYSPQKYIVFRTKAPSFAPSYFGYLLIYFPSRLFR